LDEGGSIVAIAVVPLSGEVGDLDELEGDEEGVIDVDAVDVTPQLAIEGTEAAVEEDEDEA
jgi:hypothetical protein